MTVEYLVLGSMLIVMGAVQVWFRHGPGAKHLEEQTGAAAGTDAELGIGGAPETSAKPKTDAAGQPGMRRLRSGRIWESWTSALGLVSIALGVLMVVLGVLGR